MGPFTGLGLHGSDNVSQQYFTVWIDNCGTGIVSGTGELSADSKTTTWKCTCNCPIAKKPTVMRVVETTTGPNTKSFESLTGSGTTARYADMIELKGDDERVLTSYLAGDDGEWRRFLTANYVRVG